MTQGELDLTVEKRIQEGLAPVREKAQRSRRPTEIQGAGEGADIASMQKQIEEQAQGGSGSPSSFRRSQGLGLSAGDLKISARYDRTVPKGSMAATCCIGSWHLGQSWYYLVGVQKDPKAGAYFCQTP